MIFLLRTALNHFPRLKRRLKISMQRLGLIGKVPSHYMKLQQADGEAEARRLRDAWKAVNVPVKQRALVDMQIAEYRRGQAVDVFDVLVAAMRRVPNVKGQSVLEVGCSSGFFSEVFELAGLDCRYAGCDYSEAFIQLARQKYPALRFDVEDATNLKYGDNAFDIVISGCCLLHIPEYEVAVAEAARVACRYAIFHRTPVVLGQPNVYYRKQAYGVETVEIHFNEPQFLKLLASLGLELIAIHTLDEFVQDGVGSANRTYVCKKIDS